MFLGSYTIAQEVEIDEPTEKNNVEFIHQTNGLNAATPATAYRRTAYTHIVQVWAPDGKKMIQLLEYIYAGAMDQ